MRECVVSNVLTSRISERNLTNAKLYAIRKSMRVQIRLCPHSEHLRWDIGVRILMRHVRNGGRRISSMIDACRTDLDIFLSSSGYAGCAHRFRHRRRRLFKTLFSLSFSLCAHVVYIMLTARRTPPRRCARVEWRGL